MVEFVEEWFIEQTLGEGAFGDVKLLVNRRSKDEVALKAVNFKDHPEAAEVVKKEIQIHRMLSHENIVKFYGNRRESSVEYLFLEYCSGGELYDQIEPDVGVKTLSLAQSYFRQLISAVEYLHSLGIAHRDIKPENILLDAGGKIKLSDFGFATVFRSRGVERLLDKQCGTLPYVAPEVLRGNYKAQPADIWSCGIVLLALLGGELPWDRPLNDCAAYRTWKEGKIYGMPWTKLDLNALNFMKKILNPQASKRISIDLILSHSWLNKRPTACTGGRKWEGASDESPMKKMVSGANLVSTLEDSITRLCYSQPEPRVFGVSSSEETPPLLTDQNDCGENVETDERRCFSFSQPVGTIDEYFVGSQLASTPTKNVPPIQRWVKRMTRFLVRTSIEKTIEELTGALNELGHSWKLHSKPTKSITISATDRRKMKLVFKANILDMGHELVLLDFRLSRGDGLEFKRQFVKLRAMLQHIEMPGPTTWTLATHTQTVPTLA